jgi:hypothetical protein
MASGGVEASVGLTKDQADGSYALSVYGVDIETEQVSLWPFASLEVGDEVRIVVVEVDHADQPED